LAAMFVQWSLALMYLNPPQDAFMVSSTHVVTVQARRWFHVVASCAPRVAYNDGDGPYSGRRRRI